MDLFVKQRGNGAPLILLHGWGFNHHIWEFVAERFATTWRVYEVDLPGHGKSSLCAYELPTLVECLTTHLPQKAVWLGWSLGGLLAMAVARWRPESVQSLVLVSTSPRFVTASDWPQALAPAVLQQFAQQLQRNTLETLLQFLVLQTQNDDTARQQLRKLHALLKATPPHPHALTAGLELLITTDLRCELSHIHCPTLLCLGGRDTLVPVGVGADCQRYLPTLRKVIIKPAAHLPFLSHLDIFMYLVQDFLEKSRR